MPDAAFWNATLHDTGLLALAWFLGGVIGWQREAQRRSAGLRTHMLVCGGSCLITLVSFGGLGDPGRIAAQIVTGIGFLGAGVILRRGLSVRGLTTAATIWVVSGVGIAVGAGGRFAVLGTVATLFALLTLTLAKRLEEAITDDHGPATLLVTVPRLKGHTARLMEVLTGAGAVVTGTSVESEALEGAEGHRLLRVHLSLRQDLTPAQLTDAILEKMPDLSLEWEE
ncbi:MAG TPA: MgtC/SapB family protein [Armatimonadaceae bacterium]|jgi:putative Mg2+ transporter-C (MgtC) family protein|nr:MgtC/SapB family protein [Armatimonadaceae bacterium]